MVTGESPRDRLASRRRCETMSGLGCWCRREMARATSLRRARVVGIAARAASLRCGSIEPAMGHRYHRERSFTAVAARPRRAVGVIVVARAAS
ncbi:hypothetical protein AXF42_Ash020620 [Apostasia shenzhenica]|uniref:Uncharacterized protein n=1 Tax=Apostasia shenzhenica TaxID=1088818 RepID=A0A2H9ZY69_9ASPA|nr:hypothetical protein AXF42_Ash020620 [Apostasia shenzhenica]